jgi:LPXTG-site transpeptidase (sortase) family protein
MNSIFDENSEFLKYVKGQDSPDMPDSPVSKPQMSPDSYVLDLKSHSLKDPGPVEEVPVKKVGQTSEQPKPVPKLEKLNKLEPKVSAKSDLGGFIKDKLKFLVVSGLIFGATFLVINWSAYSSIFENWYLELRGVSLETPLNQFRDNPNAPVLENLDFVANTDIPKLNLEVTPPGTRVIIPRLQSNVPVISMSTNTLISKDWNALEQEIQQALRSGVVHYPGTPFPSQSGNVVLTGHSSYYPWDPGRFKDVFAILHQATVGDDIIVFHNQKKYTYKITDIKTVLPTQVDVLGDTGDNRLTLITCTPIGTNLKRLIVTAKPV